MEFIFDSCQVEALKKECIKNSGTALEAHQLDKQNQALSFWRFSKVEDVFLPAPHIFVKYLH